MHLYLKGDDPLPGWGRVEQVDAKTGRVVFLVDEHGRGRAEARVGHRATTLHPLAEREER